MKHSLWFLLRSGHTSDTISHSFCVVFQQYGVIEYQRSGGCHSGGLYKTSMALADRETAVLDQHGHEWVSVQQLYTLTTACFTSERSRGWRGKMDWRACWSLMVYCSFLGVFYGAVCIGMAGIASMMGNILQVNLCTK